MSHDMPDEPRMVFRKTNAHVGRHISISPANSTNKHLAYGRIILTESENSASFTNGDRETGLIVLSGAATVTVEGQSFQLGQYDSIYIPRGSSIDVRTDSAVDIAEFSCEVAGQYPLKMVPYAEVAKDPTLKFAPGTAGQQREVSIVIGKNVDAGRLLLGFTVSEPGNWTSWPPHEHAVMLEEMYVYFDMPEPAFGIQMIYNDTQYPELVTVVRDGDAVTIPSGYHPNASVPGHRITFLWALAAHREKEDRLFGVVNIQPDFAPAGAAARK
jgi:5-deoxy-glucuronate isomerase